MTPALIMALSLLTVFWPFHASQQTSRTFQQPTWRFTIRRDRFTRGVDCHVFQGSPGRPSIAYARHSLAFRFSSRLSTLEASYRVDSGPTAPWTRVYPTLVAGGATLPGASMDNPTGGLVILPLSALAGGHVITIRPTPRSRPRSFNIDGLGDALANAKARGCASEAAFVR